MYISRITLFPKPSFVALRTLLLPDETGARVAAAHKLMWSLFGDHEGREADFLWKDAGKDTFLVLSRRKPMAGQDATEVCSLFRIETKQFDPAIKAGDELEFSLRVNATVATKRDGERDGHREDILTRAIRELRAREPGFTRACRDEAINEAAYKWLVQRSAANGFAVGSNTFSVENRDFVSVPRENGPPMRFGMMDLAGRIRVSDPDAFKARLIAGFGRAKRFGCGLMLVRPAR